MAGALGPDDRAAARLTNAEARDLAGYLGFTREVRDAPLNSMGQKVFSNGTHLITQDVTMHLGPHATWKMFSRGGDRLGTFDGLLNLPGK